MAPSKIRFVTVCQQLLALGLVLAALTPAASVISLDVVREHPSSGGTRASGGGVATSAYARATQQSSQVRAEVVDPTVREHAPTVPRHASSRSRAAVAANAVSVPDGQIHLQFRTRTGSGGLPPDLKLAVIDPGHADQTGAGR